MYGRYGTSLVIYNNKIFFKFAQWGVSQLCSALLLNCKQFCNGTDVLL